MSAPTKPGPRKIEIEASRNCAEGQHDACMAANDYSHTPLWPAWVCACACHPKEGEFE